MQLNCLSTIYQIILESRYIDVCILSVIVNNGDALKLIFYELENVCFPLDVVNKIIDLNILASFSKMY